MIYVLMGKSGSGKTTIEKIISNQLGLKRIITTTTRPMREKEIKDVDYHYISEIEFDKRLKEGKYIYHSIYDNWKYGIDINDIEDIGLCIMNPNDYKQLFKHIQMQMVGIVIHMDDKLRILNAINREDAPDIHEICRRFLADEIDFFNIEHDYTVWHVENSEGKLDEAVSQIEAIIKLTSSGGGDQTKNDLRN